MMNEKIFPYFSLTGGLASNGAENLLDLVPDGLHCRQPVFMGSAEDVKIYLDIAKKHSELPQQSA